MVNVSYENLDESQQNDEDYLLIIMMVVIYKNISILS